MADATGTVKRSWGVVKEHWMLFALVGLVVAGAILYYDLTSKGKATQKFADLPFGIGDKFKNATKTSAEA